MKEQNWKETKVYQAYACIYVHVHVCIYKNDIDKLSELLLRVRQLELYLNIQWKLLSEGFRLISL